MAERKKYPKRLADVRVSDLTVHIPSGRTQEFIDSFAPHARKTTISGFEAEVVGKEVRIGFRYRSRCATPAVYADMRGNIRRWVKRAASRLGNGKHNAEIIYLGNISSKLV